MAFTGIFAPGVPLEVAASTCMHALGFHDIERAGGSDRSGNETQRIAEAALRVAPGALALDVARAFGALALLPPPPPCYPAAGGPAIPATCCRSYRGRPARQRP